MACRERVMSCCRRFQDVIALLCIMLAFLPLPIAFNGDPKASIGYLVAVVAVCIITSAIPLGACGFLPVILAPVMGVCSAKDAAADFWKTIQVILIGMLTISTAIEAVDLHRRVALNTLRFAGPNHRRLLWTFGFLAFTVSLVTTNIAVIAILMPTLVELLKNLRKQKQGAAKITASGDQNDTVVIETIVDIQKEAVNNNGLVNTCKSTPTTHNRTHLHHAVTDDKKGQESQEAVPDRFESIQGDLREGKNVTRHDDICYGTNNHDPSTPMNSTSNSTTIRCEKESVANMNLDLIDEEFASSDDDTTKLGKSAALAIFYGSAFGGMSFIIGSGQNAILDMVVDEYYAARGVATPLDFVTWFCLCFPMAVCIIIVLLLWLHFLYFGFRQSGKRRHSLGQIAYDRVSDQGVMAKLQRSNGTCSKQLKNNDDRQFSLWLDEEFEKLGPIKFSEVIVILLTVVLILLMFFQNPGFMPGWNSLGLFKQGYVNHSTLVIFIASLLFVIPAKVTSLDSKSGNGPILHWKTVHEKMNWDLMMVIGGLNVIGVQARQTGLEDLLADQLSFLQYVPIHASVFIICLCITFITELVPNAIIVYVIVPVVGNIAAQQGYNPLFLMVPVGLSAQCSFMSRTSLQNVIIVSYGTCTQWDTMKAGFVTNLLATIMTAALVNVWFGVVIDIRNIPWLNDTSTNMSLTHYNTSYF